VKRAPPTDEKRPYRTVPIPPELVQILQEHKLADPWKGGPALLVFPPSISCRAATSTTCRRTSATTPSRSPPRCTATCRRTTASANRRAYRIYNREPKEE